MKVGWIEAETYLGSIDTSPPQLPIRLRLRSAGLASEQSWGTLACLTGSRDLPGAPRGRNVEEVKTFTSRNRKLLRSECMFMIRNMYTM